METIVILIKFMLTFALALAFGIERQKTHKPIGFGTFIFVSLGSCGLAIAAIRLSTENPLPLLSGIVTGIGFLGAGALIKTTDKIFGFTTAASIWVFAIIGLLIGVGDFLLAIVIYSCIWIVIAIDRYLETRGIGSYQRKLIIRTARLVSEKEVKDILLVNSDTHKLISVDIDKKNRTITYSYLIEGRKGSINKLPNILYEKDWLEYCRIE